MSHTDDCDYVEKEFIGEFPRGDWDAEAEFRICVERDIVPHKDPATWYHGQITMGNRWSDYSTVHAPSGKDTKEPVLEMFKVMRDKFNEAIEYLESL